MRNPRLLSAGTVLAVAAGLLSASAQAASAAPNHQRRVIVQLADAGTLDKLKQRDNKARDLGRLTDFVALTVPEADLAALRRTPGVKAVYPDVPMKVNTHVSVPLIGAPQVWQRNDAAGLPVTGQGVTVAVIDTGVDYSHPDLGGTFGEGSKVVGGYDFVNGDADPMDDHGHGTHVAGIVAGKAAAPGGITGVAPDAQILAYKVMDERGEGYTSDIVAGIEAAADPANPHRADVINLSLGGPGDGNDPVAQAATAAANAGVVVVASAGNNGPGAYSVGSPAVADGVIAVGASTSNVRIPVAHLAGPHPELIQTYRGYVSANPPLTPVTAELVDVGWGSPQDWERAGDVRGKMVRAEMFVSKDLGHLWEWDFAIVKEAERRGAIALLGGTSYGGGPVLAATGSGEARVQPNTRLAESGELYKMDSIVVMGIDNTQFAELGRRLAAGRVDITLSGKDSTDEIASFSSRGPSWRFGLKPDVVAPGVDIKSTVPKALFEPGQYYMSGTSMAAPHVAGAAALLRQLRPDRSPSQIKSALVNASKPLGGTVPTAHGAGRLDIVAAADATLHAEPTSLSFGLADLSNRDIGGSKRLTLSNSSDAPLTVDLGSSDRAVTVKPGKVSVPAGGTADVTVTLTAGRPDEYTQIEGTVTATPSTGPGLTIPYLLVAWPLSIFTSNDGGDGNTTVYVTAPTALTSPPVLTVHPPKGRKFTITTTPTGFGAYQARLSVPDAGAYVMSASARAATGQGLTGTGGFEVLPVEDRKQRWEPVGPNSVGGFLTQAPSAPQQAVMTQDNKAGPWLTTDGGTSWSQLNRLPLSIGGGAGHVIIDADDPNRWWYSVYDGYIGQGKILRTGDRGKTWQTVAVPGGFVSAFAADAATEVLVAAATNGLWISRDGGDTWVNTPTGTDHEVRNLAFAGDRLLMGTIKGVWARTGILSGTLGPATQVYDAGQSNIYSVVATDSVVAALHTRVGVVGSYDGGQTWSTLLPMQWGGTSLHESRGDIFLDTFFGRAHVSADDGRTWAQLDVPSRNATNADFDRWADGSLSVSAWSGGLYRADASGDGYQRIGVQGSTAFDLAVSDGHLLAGTYTGSYRTALPVASPEWGTSGAEGYIGVTISHFAVSPADSQVVYRIRRGAFGSFSVDRSSDSGQSWQELNYGNETPTALAIHPADPNRIMIGWANLEGQGVALSRDGGQTWKNLYHDDAFTAIAPDPSDPDSWWLGGLDGLYRTTDNGVTKTKVTSGWVRAIHVNGTQVVIGGDDIKVSTDNGRTFRTAHTGPLSLQVNDFVRVGDILYAATDRGVLRAGDGAMSWRNYSGGLQSRVATSLAVGPDGTSLFVGTVDGGVHRMSLSY